ncbi:ATP-binding protein [Candidatus Peregrinibacteria bacterium]|jgi:signal transduction histidine kinase|nr:ATP-binding protein [Candidatus Peregrinibacteria bacterium]MBT4056448.1 ATP-binding protein [Candidatus Peregrinibacteria bacterium]
MAEEDAIFYHDYEPREGAAAAQREDPSGPTACDCLDERSSCPKASENDENGPDVLAIATHDKICRLKAEMLRNRIVKHLQGFQEAIVELLAIENPDKIKFKGSLAHATAIEQLNKVLILLGNFEEGSSLILCQNLGIKDPTFIGAIQGLFHDIKEVPKNLGEFFDIFIKDEQEGHRAYARERLAEIANKDLLECIELVDQIFYPENLINISVEYLLPNLADALRSGIRHAEGKIPLKTVTQLAPVSRTLAVTGNMLLIISIARNLSRNASDKGATTLSITAYEFGDDWVVIKIRNDGEPIPEEVAYKIFERGVSLHKEGTKPFYGSEGIGLANSREAAESMGGYLVLADVGSTEPREDSLTLNSPALSEEDDDEDNDLGGPEFQLYLRKARLES